MGILLRSIGELRGRNKVLSIPAGPAFNEAIREMPAPLSSEGFENPNVVVEAKVAIAAEARTNTTVHRAERREQSATVKALLHLTLPRFAIVRS
jgi:hypothetical protein